MTRAPHVLLLTGSPGVGKTTVILEVAQALKGRRLGGFYTEEIRAGRERRGFHLTTFDGRGAPMARVDFRSPHRVGRYGVDVAVIDELAGSSLAPGRDLYLVDEIGKMECFSQRFVEAVRALLDGAAPVLATVAQKGAGFISEVKARQDAELWEVTRGNRDGLPDRVLDWLRART
ncbi:MAG TPA: nucleoside-triphosphatase [Methylomirabilota bacterium]|nr:nucleoside-triphosphatase [Methylomirabilota bacterium]